MADFRVKLVNSTINTENIIFNVTPDLIETRNVNYKALDPIHAPGQMMSYQNTASRSFNLSQVRLISRTEEEAATNLKYIWILKGWTMPYFGLGGEAVSGMEMRGAPPAVLLLSAYSDDNNSDTEYGKHLSKVPVVLQSLSIPYPSDCDYIPAAGTGIPMPTLMMIDMTLTETQAPVSYNKFNLGDFKLGKLGGF